jgi:Aspartyl protease
LQTIVQYRAFPDNFGSHLYWAAINVQLALPSPNAPRTKRFEAIIDSGATRCLFHANLAQHLGIDLRSGLLEMMNGIGGREELWLHSVKLHIPGGAINITAGFKENLPLAGLLGMTGFFDHFNITFEAAAKRCVLDRIYYA